MAQINNLNIFTFIKDIYQSLKHIDQCFSNFNETINNRLNKLEDNQQIIADKLANIEIILLKLSENNNNNSVLDKNLEIELLKKMNILNIKSIGNENIELKPEELTFANIIENGYTLIDINESLCKYELNNIEEINNKELNNKELNNKELNNNLTENLENKNKETLETLLF